jgi:hypothetical protein
MQDQQISVTKRSVHLIDEYRKYMLAQDKEGRFIPGVTVGHDDCLDAARYAMVSLIPSIQRKELMDNMPRLISNEERRNPAR